MAGLAPVRRRLLARARGHVVEVGVGTGGSFEFYPATFRSFRGCEPDHHMLRRAHRKLPLLACAAKLSDGSAERLLHADGSFDTVVMTFVLCTIPDPAAALAEARRVLRLDGQLLFAEHVAHPSPVGLSLQGGLNRPWR